MIQQQQQQQMMQQQMMQQQQRRMAPPPTTRLAMPQYRKPAAAPTPTTASTSLTANTAGMFGFLKDEQRYLIPVAIIAGIILILYLLVRQKK
jgi:hypothetical protein